MTNGDSRNCTSIAVYNVRVIRITSFTEKFTIYAYIRNHGHFNEETIVRMFFESFIP